MLVSPLNHPSSTVTKFVLPRTTLMLLMMYSLKVVAFCPSGCQCDDVGLRVHCVNANLDMVPILLNPGTKHLDLSHNHIKDIMPGFAFYHEMKYLDMSHNDVLSLGSKNFVSQELLTTLIVSNNRIDLIGEKTFDGLAALKEIDLSNNQIKDINKLAFEALRGLKMLNLSNNKIEVLTNYTFHELSQLNILNLCNNNIKMISMDMFHNLRELKELHLCSNYISVLDESVFKNLENLVHLSLFNNQIARLSSQSFAGLKRLKYLDVHDNLLKELTSDFTSSLTKLQELNIGMNPFSALSSGSFENITALKNLYISHCSNLTLLSDDVFATLENLFYLEISFNPNLRNLNSLIFDPLVEIRRLVLRANGLASIERSIINLQKLQYLDVRDNPFVCNCSMKWLQNIGMNRSTVMKIEEVTCTSPESLKGRILTNLTDYELECYSQLLVIASCVAVVIALVVVVIIVCVIYYRHCKKMKTLVHDHWPEKIVATWRDPEYEKQIEDEEYTFQSARSVSQIQIPVI